MRFRTTLVGAAVGAALLASGCSQPPYTRDDGHADLLEAGFSTSEANCVIDGLDAYFREEFVQKQVAEGIEDVPVQQVDNYVKNRFAGIDDIPDDLGVEADRVVADCR
jgi:hypothetical protein